MLLVVPSFGFWVLGFRGACKGKRVCSSAGGGGGWQCTVAASSTTSDLVERTTARAGTAKVVTLVFLREDYEGFPPREPNTP